MRTYVIFMCQMPEKVQLKSETGKTSANFCVDMDKEANWKKERKKIKRKRQGERAYDTVRLCSYAWMLQHVGCSV